MFSDLGGRRCWFDWWLCAGYTTALVYSGSGVFRHFCGRSPWGPPFNLFSGAGVFAGLIRSGYYSCFAPLPFTRVVHDGHALLFSYFFINFYHSIITTSIGATLGNGLVYAFKALPWSTSQYGTTFWIITEVTSDLFEHIRILVILLVGRLAPTVHLMESLYQCAGPLRLAGTSVLTRFNGNKSWNMTFMIQLVVQQNIRPVTDCRLSIEALTKTS